MHPWFKAAAVPILLFLASPSCRDDDEADPWGGGVDSSCGDAWMNNCSSSLECGSVMTCFSSCPSCSSSCKLSCLSDLDCEQYGAGYCRSAPCSACVSVCSGKPTICDGSGVPGGGGYDDDDDGCVPDCRGKECGDDGCGGDCGSCSFGEHCDGGWCAKDCECDPGEVTCRDDYYVLACNDGCNFSEYHCGSEVCYPDYSYYEYCGGSGPSLVDVCQCRKGGIGDPCDEDGACNSGTCFGWCTRPCATFHDCDGDFSYGSNMYGFFQTCVENVQGNRYCFPHCQFDSDCEPFGGATCEELTFDNGVAVVTQKICTF